MSLYYSSIINRVPGNNDLQTLLYILTSAGAISASFLTRKKLRKLKWQYFKNLLKSFFKKEQKEFVGSFKFWLLLSGIFVLLWLLVNLLTAAIVIAAALLLYIIIANKQPSY
jgi:Flp pilus assembly protein TadB